MATLWDAAARAGLSTASVQWPASVGARVTWNIPEFWRSGAPDDAKLLRAVSTPGLLAELEPELGPYPRALTVESDEQRVRYAVRILEKKRPNLLTLHLIALDHVQHVTGPFTAETMAALERIDTLVGTLRATAETVAPGGAHVAIVSDHGFGKTAMELNLLAEFRRAGLVTVSAGKVTDWKAMPWTAGGTIAVVLKDPADADYPGGRSGPCSIVWPPIPPTGSIACWTRPRSGPAADSPPPRSSSGSSRTGTRARA